MKPIERPAQHYGCFTLSSELIQYCRHARGKMSSNRVSKIFGLGSHVIRTGSGGCYS